MEINVKVSVEGVVRDVCGVNEATTCEEVIFKLAQAACLPGFYTLVAKHYTGETTLAPEEKLINFIRTLGENPANVHFVLCRLEAQSISTNCLSGNRGRTQQLQASVPRPLAPQSQPVDRTESHRQLPSHISSYSKTPSGQYPPTVASSHKTNVSGCFSPVSRASMSTDSKLPTQATLVSTGDVGGDALTEDAQYAQLEDQLASQEHEVELNRIRLLQLDKAIENLDHSNRQVVDGGVLTVGPAAELAQLTATPWPQLLEANRARQLDLIRERERYQMAIDQLDSQLVKAQDEATKMETQLNQELQQLLTNLESVNAHRRQLLHSLSPSSRPNRGRNFSAKDVDGVAV